MARKPEELVVCQICGRQKRLSQAMPAELVRSSIAKTIAKKHPEWSSGGFICLSDLNNFRKEHVEDVLELEKGELSALDRDVLKSLEEHELISQNINKEFDRELTFGERLSDRIAEVGGSWYFIIAFGIFLLIWMIINGILLLRPYDPFPFILLNLMLSTLAAIQAPVIMMSQNRQEERDRLRSENDYRVNLKAEMEIRHLNEKLDHLLRNQWHRLLEIQRIQMELMEERDQRKYKQR